MTKLITVILCVFTAFCSISAVEIVKDGKPLAQIVVAKDADSAEKFSAADLQHWIKEITGAKLPIVNTPVKGKPDIIIGRKSAENIWGKVLARLKFDGFAIQNKGDDIYLFGRLPRSSAYAVAHLLETNTDIIWARPDVDYGTVFSKTKDLDLKNISVIENPVFRYHGWNVVAIRRDLPTAQWVLRNRGNWADQACPVSMGNEYDFIVSTGGHIYWWMAHPSKYFKTNPEFYGYSKLSGKREPKTLCLTNPELLKLAVANLKKRMKELKDQPIDIITLGFRDSWNMCMCDECLKPIDIGDGKMLARKSDTPQADPKFYSTRYWKFISKIAAELKKTFPNTTFCGMGYFYAAEPPACEIDPSLNVAFAPIGGLNPYSPILSPNQAPIWRRRLEEWAKRFPDRLFFYEYFRSYGSGFMPVHGNSTLKLKFSQDLRDLYRLHGLGVFCELTPDSKHSFSGHSMKSEWDANSVGAWIYSRLMWNPGLDVQKLEDYYLERTFREAAPAMKRFYKYFDEGVAKSKKQRSTNFTKIIINSGLMKKCAAALDEAEKKAKHPNSLTMIKRLKAQWFLTIKKLAYRSVPIMDKEEKFTEFDATCWEPNTTFVIDDFRIPRCFDWGYLKPAPCKTDVRLLSDGDNLFVRVNAENPSPNIMPKSEDEKWPLGDNLELQFSRKRQLITFAFDGNGNAYDSLNSDRSWNSNWKVIEAGKTPNGWQALVSIPLKDIGVNPADRKTFPGLLVVRNFDNGKLKTFYSPDGNVQGCRKYGIIAF